MYMKHDPIKLHRNKSLERLRDFRRGSITYDDMGGIYIIKCIELISMLKAFNKHKPNESTINSTIETLISKYCYAAYALPDEVLSDIDNDKSDTNQKLDDLKYICEVMKRNGVTDRQYDNIFFETDVHYNRYTSLVRMVYCDKMAEAVDLARFLEKNTIQPDGSWFHRIFFIQKPDDITIATLNRMLYLYIYITDRIC